MSPINPMYRLQKLDSEADRCRVRIREINAALESNEALREAQAQVAALQQTLRPQETRAVDLNLEIKTVGEQSAQFGERLYGGSVHNPKELEDLHNKIDERKRRRAHLEDELLETMIRVEELQAELASAQTHLAQLEAAWGEQQNTLNSELHRLKHELKSLKADRQAAVEALAPGDLELYDTLRAQKRGQAVAVLEGDSCSVCRVEQTENIVQQVRRGQQLVKCTSCGRILVTL